MPQITPFQDILQSLASANLTVGTNAVVPPDFKPTVDLILNYNGKQVDMGNLFPTTECTNAPNITFFSEDPTKSSLSYTLLLVDPDAPSPQEPLYADWCHWIVPGLMPVSYDNIITTLSNPPNSTSEANADSVIYTRMPIVPYSPPNPRVSSEPHRYVFLLYREPSSSAEMYTALKAQDIGIDPTNPSTRKTFKPSKFAEAYDLKLVGVNWFKGVNPARLEDRR